MMSTAFIRAVMWRFPKARVDLIVRAGFNTLPLPHRGRVLAFDRKRISAGRFGGGLRDAGYSHFFVLPPSFSSAWMAFRSRISCRVGYRGEGRGWLLQPAMEHRHPPRSVHLVQEYLDMLLPWLEPDTRLHTKDHPAGLELPDGWADQHQAEALRASPPYVVLAPGAEYGTAKQWHQAGYRETAKRLSAAGWRVVVVGLPQDKPMGDALVEDLGQGSSKALNLCGQTGLNQMVGVLAGSSLLVSNDSGAMHVGAALGLPQIAVFGSTNPNWTAPLNSRAHLFYRGESCSPCYARTCPLGHRNCLEGIAGTEVADKALAMLDEPR